MSDEEILLALDGRQVLALTLYGEARSEGVEGRIAVASVVRNRVASGRDRDYRAVCLAPFQFSCWGVRGGRQNHETVLAAARDIVAIRSAIPPLVRECLWIAEGVIAGDVLDPTGGADHYLTTALYDSPAAPAWARRLRVTTTIGRHVFLTSRPDGAGDAR